MTTYGIEREFINKLIDLWKNGEKVETVDLIKEKIREKYDLSLDIENSEVIHFLEKINTEVPLTEIFHLAKTIITYEREKTPYNLLKCLEEWVRLDKVIAYQIYRDQIHKELFRNKVFSYYEIKSWSKRFINVYNRDILFYICLDDERLLRDYESLVSEIIRWGGTDREWIGLQQYYICDGLRRKGKFKELLDLLIGKNDFPVTHKIAFIKIVADNTSDNSDILWNCAIKLEDYVKRFENASGLFDLIPRVKYFIYENKEFLNSNFGIEEEVISFIDTNTDLEPKDILNYIKKLSDATNKIDYPPFDIDVLINNLRENEEAIKKFGKEKLDEEVQKLLTERNIIKESEKIRDEVNELFMAGKMYLPGFFFNKDNVDIFNFARLKEDVKKYKLEAILLNIKEIRKSYINKLSNAKLDESEKEIIINDIENETNRVVQKVIEFENQVLKNQVEKELKGLFGDINWGYLRKDTQTLLISADIIYKRLADYDNEVDYSGATLPLTKALEKELYRFFYEEYLSFQIRNRLSIPEVLSTSKDFTMGSVKHYFRLRKGEYFENGKRYFNNKYRNTSDFKFVRGLSVPNPSKPSGKEDLPNRFCLDLEDIKSIRDEVAHKEGISKVTSDQCRDLMFQTKRFFVNFINNISK